MPIPTITRAKRVEFKEAPLLSCPLEHTSVEWLELEVEVEDINVDIDVDAEVVAFDRVAVDAQVGQTFFLKYSLWYPTTLPGGVYSQTTYHP